MRWSQRVEQVRAHPESTEHMQPPLSILTLSFHIPSYAPPPPKPHAPSAPLSPQPSQVMEPFFHSADTSPHAPLPLTPWPHSTPCYLYTRQVMEPSFLEPSTGRRYSPSACPYEGVEFIWNAANFWVCMQVGGGFRQGDWRGEG